MRDEIDDQHFPSAFCYELSFCSASAKIRPQLTSLGDKVQCVMYHTAIITADDFHRKHEEGE